MVVDCDMNKTTAKALEESIVKWDANSRAKRPIDYLVDTKDCPLCELFFADGCEYCPVSEKVNDTTCDSTPFRKACSARDAWILSGGNPHLRDKAHEAAHEERDFLISLRDEK